MFQEQTNENSNPQQKNKNPQETALPEFDIKLPIRSLRGVASITQGACNAHTFFLDEKTAAESHSDTSAHHSLHPRGGYEDSTGRIWPTFAAGYPQTVQTVWSGVSSYLDHTYLFCADAVMPVVWFSPHL